MAINCCNPVILANYSFFQHIEENRIIYKAAIAAIVAVGVVFYLVNQLEDFQSIRVAGGRQLATSDPEMKLPIIRLRDPSPVIRKLFKWVQ
jgi:hypothetical protein